MSLSRRHGPIMETKEQLPSNRRRHPWVAVVLALLNPALGMLYVGRPRRAALYFVFTVLLPLGAFYLAISGLWPTGLSSLPVVYLVTLAGMIDGYRIARTYESGFTGPWFTTWKGLTAIGASVILLLVGVRMFIFEPFLTPSSAMLPTLHEGDHFFVSKLAFRDTPPQRGDLIVHRLPEGGLAYVKRVVGLPGDVVEYDQGSKRLTINGGRVPVELLGDYEDDPRYRLTRENLDGVEHLIVVMPERLARGGIYTVPDDHFFVMGDNRDNSRDSRFSDFGFVAAEDIVGKVTFVWWNTNDPKRAGIVPE